MSSPLPFQHLTVIGLGLIGGSFAMAARERYPALKIRGVDPVSETLQYALRSQVVDEVSLTLPTDFDDDHLVVLASHLSVNQRLLADLAPPLAGRAIWVTDVGSCKQAICQQGQALLPQQFIGGHPMAGKELSGIAHATALLFSGKVFFLCPGENSPPAGVEALSRFLEGLGTLPQIIDPVAHDRAMAVVSHLPHLYSVVLANFLLGQQPGRVLPYAGPSLSEHLRLSGSDYTMWRDILTENRENIQPLLHQLGGCLQEAAEDLTPESLAQAFTQANRLYQEHRRIQQGRY